uniref:Reverse transcriptase Ty1/copia-type domain-containing protein n=1 Tax=Chenopodium quinoa TaxID=63459 RepID=A0A803M681_CHEQI
MICHTAATDPTNANMEKTTAMLRFNQNMKVRFEGLNVRLNTMAGRTKSRGKKPKAPMNPFMSPKNGSIADVIVIMDISGAAQDKMSISEYYNHLKKLWDELDNLCPLPSCTCNNCSCALTQKYFKIHQDQSFEHNDKVTEPVAFAADRRRFDDRGGQNYRNFGSYGRGYNQNGSNKFAPGKRTINYYCDHCKMTGHNMERCFKLHGFPLGYKGNQSFSGAKKFANCVEGNTGFDEAESSDQASLRNLAASFTLEELTQMRSFLNKQKTEDNGDINAMFAGYVQSKNDYSLFIKSNNHHFIIAVVYVDDIVITGSDVLQITSLKQHLHDVFSIKDLGVLSYFLGMEIGYNNHCITLSQAKFTREILESGLNPFKSFATPLPLHLKLNSDDRDVLDDPLSYRCLVRKLNFLTHTRLDLAFTVHSLSQFMQIPRSPHMQALTHALNYVASTANQGIIFKGAMYLPLDTSRCNIGFAHISVA